MAKIQFKHGEKINLPDAVLSGEMLVTTDTLDVQFGDIFGGRESILQVHVGPNQPLGTKKLWADTVEMTLKHNTGEVWELMPGGDPGPTDLGEFVDSLHVLPISGDYPAIQKITLSSTLSKPIYYTTNGAEPTSFSTLYTGPFDMFNGMLRAKSITDSEVSIELIATFSITVAERIVITPGSGSYQNTQGITLVADSGKPVRYTLDGSTPTLLSNQFVTGMFGSDPIAMFNGTIKAVTFNASDVASEVFTATYTIAPFDVITISKDSGAYTEANTITLQSLYSYDLYYTTDGSDPNPFSTLYTAPISMFNGTLKVLSIHGMGNSAILSRTYTLDFETPDVVTISKDSGAYPGTDTITLQSQYGYNLYYTLDGSFPTIFSNLYTMPINMFEGTLKVRSINGAIVSTVSMRFYTLAVFDTITIEPSGGNILANSEILLHSANHYPMYYTIDGSDPNIFCTQYIDFGFMQSAPIPAFNGTLKVRSIVDADQSEVTTAIFTIATGQLLNCSLSPITEAPATGITYSLFFDTALISENCNFFQSYEPFTLEYLADPYNNSNGTLEPNVPFETQYITIYAGSAMYIAVTNSLNEVLVEQAYIVNPIIPTLTITYLPIVDTDPAVINFDIPLPGSWYLCAKENSEPTLDDSIVYLGGGQTNTCDLSKLLYPGNWQFKLFFAYSTTVIVSNTLEITLPGLPFLPAPQVWQGYGLTFVKPSDTSPDDYKDVISNEVTLTSYNSNDVPAATGGYYIAYLINSVLDDPYDPENAPLGVKFAFLGATGNTENVISDNYANLTFSSLSNSMSSVWDNEGWMDTQVLLINRPMVIWLVKANIYMDFKILSLNNRADGSIAYQRSTATSVR